MNSVPPTPEDFNVTSLAHKQEEVVAYKFFYSEFEGPQGYSLLHEIINHILPQALADTWFDLTRVQKDNEMPYGGINHLTKFRGLGERAIQKRFQRLVDMNLMRKQPALRSHMDTLTGEISRVYRVDYKDFTNLYHLSMLYLRWTQTNEYQLFQPKNFDDVPSIMGYQVSPGTQIAKLIAPHRRLQDFLRQFENYRIILETSKPGPKRVNFERPRFVDPNSSVSTDECTGVYYGHELQDPNVEFNDNSPYESYLSNKRFGVDSSAPKFQNPPEEIRGNAGSDTTSFQVTSAQSSTVSSNLDKTEILEEMSAKRKTSDRVVGGDKQDWKAGTSKERYKRTKEGNVLITKYPEIVSLCTHFAGKFNDQSGKSTMIGICNLFERSQMSHSKFIELMELAGQRTAGVADRDIRIRVLNRETNSLVANKMPLFMSIIRKSLEVQPTSELVPTVEITSEFTHTGEEISVEIAPQVVEVLEVQPTLEPVPTTDEEVFDPSPIQLAMVKLRNFTDLNLFKNDSCNCGTGIMCVYNHAMRCIVCNPPSSWSEYTRSQVWEVLHPEINEVEEVIDDELTDENGEYQLSSDFLASIAASCDGDDSYSQEVPENNVDEEVTQLSHQRAIDRAKAAVYGLLLPFQDPDLYEQECHSCGCPLLILGKDYDGTDALFCIMCQPLSTWSDWIKDQIQKVMIEASQSLSVPPAVVQSEPVVATDLLKINYDDQMDLSRRLKELERKRVESERAARRRRLGR